MLILENDHIIPILDCVKSCIKLSKMAIMVIMNIDQYPHCGRRLPHGLPHQIPKLHDRGKPAA